jgi:hypothetical protein
MNKLIFISILLAFSLIFYGQDRYDSIWKNKASSIFNDIDTGYFKGVTSGDLNIVYDSIKNLSLDFRDTETELNIKKDVYQIYDNSTKIYTTQTTSGKTLIKYETYAIGNVLTIVFNNEHYSIGSLDGSSDNPIFGLSYKYTNDKKTEYLTLIATDNFELTTTRHLMRSKKIGYPQAKLNAQSITILKGSKLTLTIKK